jgi:ornithine cyclodeaminase/alanine dehydrogenase-like protein (mu-crystallin family)
VIVAQRTSARKRLLRTRHKPLASAGAYKPTTREVDSETIRRCSNLVIDSRADCLDHAGDFIIPVAEGLIERDAIAEIVRVRGRHGARTMKSRITSRSAYPFRI